MVHEVPCQDDVGDNEGVDDGNTEDVDSSQDDDGTSEEEEGDYNYLEGNEHDDA